MFILLYYEHVRGLLLLIPLNTSLSAEPLVVQMKLVVVALLALVSLAPAVWAANGTGGSFTPGQLSAQPAKNFKNSVAEIAKYFAWAFIIMGGMMVMLIQSGHINDPNLKAKRGAFILLVIFGGLIYFVAERDTILRWVADFFGGFFQ